MPDAKNNLFLFEALELRAEFDDRIETLNSLLPEKRETREFRFTRERGNQERPAQGLDLTAIREEIESLRVKRRKLNTAVQKVNYEQTIQINKETMSLAEALELRKETCTEITQLKAQFANAAYENVIYKEDRDIVEPPPQDFDTIRKKLNDRRLLFRALNRALQRTNHEVTVNFKDE